MKKKAFFSAKKIYIRLTIKWGRNAVSVRNVWSTLYIRATQPSHQKGWVRQMCGVVLAISGRDEYQFKLCIPVRRYASVNHRRNRHKAPTYHLDCLRRHDGDRRSRDYLNQSVKWSNLVKSKWQREWCAEPRTPTLFPFNRVRRSPDSRIIDQHKIRGAPKSPSPTWSKYEADA